MSGTINLALTQQFDMDGAPLSGGLLYFYVAGTTTPQSAYQDVDLTITHPNPIELDASGRVPMFYLADGFIKIRLTDSGGVTVIAADQLLVIGPSSGGGGGSSVDATSVMSTGDIKHKFGTGTLDGYVRCNGNTVGSPTSGATERANADCQSLFEYLWNTGVLQVYNGGTPIAHGASANADWLANRRIIVPDLRGRVIAGLDDMGATAAARLGVIGLGGNLGTALGSAGGQEADLIELANLPAHTHTVGTLGGTATTALTTHTHTYAGTTGIEVAPHTHQIGAFTGSTAVDNGATKNVVPTTPTASIATGDGTSHQHGFSGTTDPSASLAHTHPLSITGATGSVGSSTTFNITQPTMVMTAYIKL